MFSWFLSERICLFQHTISFKCYKILSGCLIATESSFDIITFVPYLSQYLENLIELWWKQFFFHCDVRNYINRRDLFLKKWDTFLVFYGDIDLVGHVLKSHKVWGVFWKIWPSTNQIYISIDIQNWYHIWCISIWDQFKIFKASDAAFRIRQSWWPRKRFTFKVAI